MRQERRRMVAPPQRVREELSKECITTILMACDKPAGNIRITATEYATEAVLLPKHAKLLQQYPDINVEIVIDYGLTDIVAQDYDAGVRSGEQVAKDMIAVRIASDMRMAVVGSPSYFKSRPELLANLSRDQDANAVRFRSKRTSLYVRFGLKNGLLRSSLHRDPSSTFALVNHRNRRVI